MNDLLGFGDFELDVKSGELWCSGDPVPLRPLAGRALTALAENAGQVLTRDELRGLLWPDAVVAWDVSLNQCIRQVRRALGDDASSPIFLETVPRRGYRFCAAVSRRRGIPGRRQPIVPERARARVAFLLGAATALAVPGVLLLLCIVLNQAT